MKDLLNPNVLSIKKSGIREFTALAKQTEGAIFLTIGEPDFDTPQEIRNASKDALDRGVTHYPENNGDGYIRKAISGFEQKKHGLCYSPDEVVLTIGATEALFATLFTIICKGDEIVVPVPAFGLYEQIINMVGGKYVPLDTTGDNFDITENNLKSVLTDRTKAIILTSPGNPTGCIYSKQTLETIRDIIKDKDIFVICDEVYRDLIFVEQFVSFSSFSDMRKKIIVVNSFSKPYAMTGFRAGYLMADYAIKSEIEKVHQYTVVSAVSFVQNACEKALSYDISEMVSVYRRRRDYVLKRLSDMGLQYVEPKGAFYVFPSIKKYSENSFDFCVDMVKKAKLALIPGSCFGAEGFVRISYCYNDEILKQGLDRLEGYLNELGIRN